jgi:hypothetical protein
MSTERFQMKVHAASLKLRRWVTSHLATVRWSTVVWGTVWAAITVLLLVWWASWGGRLVAQSLEAALRLSTPSEREAVVAFLGGFFISWKMITGPLYRRLRWRLRTPVAVSAGAPAGTLVPTPHGQASRKQGDWSVERRARHEAAHAVACAWAGDRVQLVDVHEVAGRGGRMVPEHAQKPYADHSWGLLVTLVAGQLVDVESGTHDYGASNDIAQALEAVAAILSTGQRPTGYTGDLTSDGLFTAARKEAAAAIAQHADVVDAVAAALIANPARPLCGSALDALLEPITRTHQKGEL